MMCITRLRVWQFCYSFFFNDTATPEIYTYGHTLSLHDALPIWCLGTRNLFKVVELGFQGHGAAVFANAFAVLPELVGNRCDLVEEDRPVGGVSLERILAAI